MPKFSGLSHLADVAREQMEDVHCYPVRRRGARRQLLPNQDGIDWLESDANNFEHSVEIYQETEVPEDGIIFTRAEGANERDYSRPIFQLIYDGNFSGSKQKVQPCEACDNWAYSWDCDVHPQIPWNTLHRRWDRPCTNLPSCGCTPCSVERRDRAEMQRAFLRERESSPSGIVSDFAQQLLDHVRGMQPVERRVNVHPYGFEVHDTGAGRDGRAYFDETVIEAERRRQMGRYLALADSRGTLEGTWRIDDDMGTLRISGESEQGIDSFTIEVDSRG